MSATSLRARWEVCSRCRVLGPVEVLYFRKGCAEAGLHVVSVTSYGASWEACSRQGVEHVLMGQIY